jgi:hypothetical protein
LQVLDRAPLGLELTARLDEVDDHVDEGLSAGRASKGPRLGAAQIGAQQHDLAIVRLPTPRA